MRNRISSVSSLGVLAALLPTVLLAQTAEAGKKPSAGKLVLYAAVGSELMQYDLDPDSVSLIKRGSVTLPANVQEAWLHPSRKNLYVAWSNNTVAYSPSVPGASKG